MISTMGSHIINSDWDNVNQLLSIIFIFIHDSKNIPNFLSGSGLRMLVDVFNSQIFDHVNYFLWAMRGLKGVIRYD
jgi:hypothetical protein